MAWEFFVDMPNFQGEPQPPYRLTELLGNGDSNAKFRKSELYEAVLTYGLSLAPSKASGYNLCTHASGGCIKDCIFKSGQAQMTPRRILPPRIAKSRLLRKHPDIFHDRLIVELRTAERRASKLQAKLFVRLNVFSDVIWEDEMSDIFTMFPAIQFYDYTKHPDRFRRFMNGGLPVNYHLTFSRSEDNWSDCVEFLGRGYNVAVPFHVKKSEPLPTTYLGWEVMNGDDTDLRPLDPSPRIIGLKVKGSAAKKDFSTGFIVILERRAA